MIGSASLLLTGSPVLAGAEELASATDLEPKTEGTVSPTISSTTGSETTGTPSEETTSPEVTTPSEKSEDSEDSGKTTVPESPTTPEVPTAPTEPVKPEEPAKPVEPATPVTPTTPKETPKEETAPKKGENSGIVKVEEPRTDSTVQETVPVAQPEVVQPETQPIVSQVESQPVENLVPSTEPASDGAIHFEKNESVESFIKKIGEPARKIGQKEDLYASVMIAQAILESASGTSELAQAPNNNLFGIKGSHKGKSATFQTQEDTGNGSMTTIQASFRAYDNYEESFEDYAKLMKEGISGATDYYSGAWKSQAKTYEEATKFLTGRYATDTSYNQKLNGLIETYQLTEYDKEKAETTISAQGFALPVENYTISSVYGARGGEFHRGLDMAAAQGEPIYASKAGTVTTAEFHYSWGNYVTIAHEDGVTTLYAHQSQYVVKPGDQVEQGQIIGYVGSTGNSTGSHLHFEICQDSSLSQAQLIDPASVLF